MEKEIGFVGLGKMGAAMSAHLVEEGYRVHGFDVNENARSTSKDNGVVVYDTYTELVHALSSPRTVWLMVPSKFVDDALAEITPLLDTEDTIIDGGNSFFKDSIRRHKDLEKKGIRFLDCGTSGGVEGAREGASLMVGGSKECFSDHEYLFKALATKDGYGHVGGPGAGHFVKMVHNGIEYGMMGAIAEGINVLTEHKENLDLDLKEAFKAYEHGSIISSELVSWLSRACNTPGYLDSIAGTVPRGKTEPEMEYIESIADVKVLSAALVQRKATRENPSYIGTLISAMRNQFGGHKVIKKDDSHS